MRLPDRLVLCAVASVALSFCGCSETTTEVLGENEPDAGSEDTREFDDDAVTIGGEDDAGGDGEDAGGDGGSPDTGPDVPDADPPGTALCDGLARADEIWVPDNGDFVFRDDQTGSLWNLRGQAFSGPCEGVELPQLPAFTVFWFSWSTSRHGGEIWNREFVNETAPIEEDFTGDCLVPCPEIRSGGPPPDGIPALDHEGRWDRPQPAQMVPAAQATYLDDSDLVLGVYLEGEARAYPHNLFWWHEIHVDAIGDREFNVTYCPLTGSGIVIDGVQGGEPFYAYVSGRLYNSNLTMFERDVDDPTFWNQMLLRGIEGPRMGERLDILPVTETTWGRWRQMHPNTLVTSDDTGYDRNYDRYPYGDYITDNEDTFFAPNPPFADTYASKDLVLALEGEDLSRAYAFPEMESFGDRVVINDRFEEAPIVVVYDAEHQMAVPFARALGDATLTFSGTTAP